MNLLSVKDLTKIGREKPLFKNVTFGLDEGHKAALIGRNGTGKSTMLNCIAGIIAPDEGSVVFNKESGFSFLPQNPDFIPEHTIYQHIFEDSKKTQEAGSSGITASSSKLEIIREYEKVCAQIAENDDSPNTHAAFEKITKLMGDKDLWTYEAEVKSILTVLGITTSKGEGLNRKMSELSGGMLKKVALAQVLVEDTKVLLLDEPTNHLDIKTITWLEDYLKNTKRSVLMVTHDRYFLDAVCSDIFELEHGKFNRYKGNFSDYLEKKAIEQEIAENTERRIESVLRTERDWLMRGPCARGTKARARVDNIHRLINREKIQADKSFSFEVAGRRLGGKILELNGISKNYEKAASMSPVISDFSYIFKKNERIGIFGSNGSGKTTLLNMITGRIPPDKGEIISGVNTVFGYYEQNPFFADTSLTVLEYLKEAAEHITLNSGKTLSAGQLLEQFGFEGKILHSMVKTLSGGERKRLYLIRLLLSNPNFLILDEPTNDFDIFTMSVLESFLQDFPGCILIVSHDRCFMDKIADTLFILEDDGSVSGYVGKCSEYLDYLEEKEAQQKKTERAAQTAQTNTEQAAQKTQDAEAPQKKTESAKKRRTFKEQKEYDSIEDVIFEKEDRKNTLEALLSGGETDHTKLADYSREYSALSEELETLYARWEYLAQLEAY